VAIPVAKRVEQVYPAYQGEIAIDPASGAIMRITVLADLAPRYQRVNTAIMVEYGPVEIGGTTYICPLKGVAFSKMPMNIGAAEPDSATPVQTQMNDVTFTDYHLFRSESRIVPADAESAPEPPTPPPQ